MNTIFKNHLLELNLTNMSLTPQRTVIGKYEVLDDTFHFRSRKLCF